MRARRSIVVASMLGAFLAWPLEAAADGGAYIEFDETHYLPGDAATGTGYVAIPESRQDLLERGPFTVYVVPPEAWIEAGRPLPEGVIPVGTATFEQEERTTFEVRVAFAVPDVPGAYYNVQICNEPCTILGFREPLSGSISIVQTEREAQLLNEQQELYGQYWSTRHQLRKARRALEELQATTPGADRVVELNAEIDRLESELEETTAASIVTTAVAPVATAADARPLVDAWALVTIVVALLVAITSVALGVVFGRRHVPTLVVPDTIA